MRRDSCHGQKLDILKIFFIDVSNLLSVLSNYGLSISAHLVIDCLFVVLFWDIEGLSLLESYRRGMQLLLHRFAKNNFFKNKKILYIGMLVYFIDIITLWPKGQNVLQDKNIKIKVDSQTIIWQEEIICTNLERQALQQV